MSDASYVEAGGLFLSRGQLDALVGQRNWESPWLGGSAVSGPSAKLRMPELSRPAEQMVSVFAALNARNEMIRKVPMRISDGSDNIIEGGNLVELLARPNQWMDCVQYIVALETYLALYDEVYVAIVMDGGPAPVSLMPLSPRDMDPVWGVHEPTGKRVPYGWIHRDAHTGVSTEWRWDEVIPIVGFNPHAPFSGLSAMTAGRRSMQQDLATRDANLALFVNGGMPDVVLETDQNITREQHEEFMRRWSEKYTGYSNSHKAAMLYNGLKAKVLGLNPEELQALEALKFTLRDVVMVMRVMPAMLGVMEGETGLSQGSSTEEQKVAWWNQTGLGELSRIAAAHQAFLVDRFAWKARGSRGPSRAERHARKQFCARRALRYERTTNRKTSRLQVWFDEGQIEELVEHRMKRLEQMVKVAGLGYLPDELNDYFDLGLPEHPTNVGMVPFSWQAVGGVALESGTEERGETRRGSGSGDLVEGEATTNPPAALCAALRAGSANDANELVEGFRALRGLISGGEQRALEGLSKKLRPKFERLRKKAEKQGTKKWSRYFMEQRKRVLAALTKQRGRRSANERMAVSLGDIFDRNGEDGALRALLTPLFAAVSEEAWDFFGTFDVVTETENAFSVDDPRIRDAIDRRVIQGTQANDKTEEDLRAILKANVDEGGTLGDLEDAIAGYYAEHVGETKARPRTAARTQMNGLVNDGRMAAAQSVGGMLKFWIHGSPDDPREHHIAAEGKYSAAPIPLDEPFVLETGVSMNAPGDASAPVGETANCTCFLGFVAAES